MGPSNTLRAHAGFALGAPPGASREGGMWLDDTCPCGLRRVCRLQLCLGVITKVVCWSDGESGCRCVQPSAELLLPRTPQRGAFAEFLAPCAEQQAPAPGKTLGTAALRAPCATQMTWRAIPKAGRAAKKPAQADAVYGAG